MLKEHRVLQIPTITGESIEIEVNWSDHDDIKDCQMLKVRFGDVEGVIKRDDLMSVVMSIGSASDVKNALPMKLSNVRRLERMLTFQFKSSQDIKAGEIVTLKAPWIDKIENVEEVLAGSIKQNKSPSKRFLK